MNETPDSVEFKQIGSENAELQLGEPEKKELSQGIIDRTENLVGKLDKNGYNIDFDEGYPKIEAVIKKINEGNITTQIISDLNYLLPDNLLKQPDFISNLKSQIGSEKFSQLRQFLSSMLQSNYEEDMKIIDKSSTGVGMIDTEGYSLYKAMFGKEFMPKLRTPKRNLINKHK